MNPRVENLTEKTLIGKRITMSLTNNKTGELWRSFMPRRKEIQNSIGTELYSIQIYDPMYFKNFNPDTHFIKWAAIEVMDFNTLPEEMETIILPEGPYAVFLHKGGAETAPKTFQFIFETWLPDSEYTLDNRPHFELLGEKYKNNDPGSEEEIWIPVKPKKQ